MVPRAFQEEPVPVVLTLCSHNIMQLVVAAQLNGWVHTWISSLVILTAEGAIWECMPERRYFLRLDFWTFHQVLGWLWVVCQMCPFWWVHHKQYGATLGLGWMAGLITASVTVLILSLNSNKYLNWNIWLDLVFKTWSLMIWRVSSEVTQFADYAKLVRDVRTREDCKVLQRDLSGWGK